MTQQITITSTSGQTVTVCREDALPEFHKACLDECERLRKVIKEMKDEQDTLNAILRAHGLTRMEGMQREVPRTTEIIPPESWQSQPKIYEDKV